MVFSPAVHETDLAEGVCISAPATGPYQEAAGRLKAALEDTLSGRVEVLPDERLDADGRHVIALGNMMDSAFLRTLYFRAYDLTDRVWPGPGGWAIRTAPHSLDGVGHVVVVGVSQAEDVSGAAEALGGVIEASGPVLPFQYRVQLGRWSDLYLTPAREMLARRDRDLEQESIGGGSGDWTYMMVVADIGMLAVQTGMEGLMGMFCQQVCHFARTRWFERELTDPTLIHGFIRILLLPFSILENHPGLPNAQREETLDALLGLFRSAEGAGNRGLLAQVGVDQVRQNHQTRSALDLFYGGRYFHQVHGLAEGLAWMKLAEVFFAPQMASNKPVCDSWGHQWAASLFNTADYALASGKMGYFSSRPYLEGVDRALIAHSSLEGAPEQYCRMAAAVTGNDEYLQLCETSDEDAVVERAVRVFEEPLRTWVTGRQAVVPERLGRVGAAPLSRLFYDSIESYTTFAPENGVYLRNLPYDQTFDKVFFRSGWTEEDDYLLLDGISGGSHSYQDGNCIVRYTSRGASWFKGSGGNAPASVRGYTGVSLAVDGSGPGCESRYAALRYLQEGETLSVAGTSMTYPEQGDWYRHIVYSREGWFLVVDEVWPHVTGEFLVECRWHLLGEVTLAEGLLCSVQGEAQLRMRHVGSGQHELVASDDACVEDYSRWVQRSVAQLEPGTGTRFGTLFWTDRVDGGRDYSLLEEDTGFRIEGEGEPVRVVFTERGETPEVTAAGATLPTCLCVLSHAHLPARSAQAGRQAAGRNTDASDAAPFRIAGGEARPVWRATCAEHVTALDIGEEWGFAGDVGGGVTSFSPEGDVLWKREVGGGVRALAVLEDGGVAVGGDRETVYRLDASGDAVWSYRIEWQRMNWDSWTQKNCVVLSLATGDINGDGREEILAGCADRHVYAFDDGGNLLWRSACQWGPPVCLVTARLMEGPEQQTLAGLADPAIHAHTLVYGRDGTLVQTLSRPDIVSWSIPSWSRCLRAADVDGDGREEVISGVDTNHRQLILYRRDGGVIWDADLGGAVLAVEAFEGRVYAGASNGFVQCFGTGGNRLWRRFLAEPVVGLAPDVHQGCLVALRGGTVVSLDGSGKIKTTDAGTSEATAAAWASPEGGLLVGRKDGTFELYR